MGYYKIDVVNNLVYLGSKVTFQAGEIMTEMFMYLYCTSSTNSRQEERVEYNVPESHRSLKYINLVQEEAKNLDYQREFYICISI